MSSIKSIKLIKWNEGSYIPFIQGADYVIEVQFLGNGICDRQIRKKGTGYGRRDDTNVGNDGGGDLWYDMFHQRMEH